MSLLLQYRKLGIAATLRVDLPELEDIAKDLHTSALDHVSSCAPDQEADLVWQAVPDGRLQILLKGQPWGDGPMQPEELYLHSDSLLDDLVRERLMNLPVIHAGGVVDRAQRGVVICGGSGAGKTSLVLSAILRGWNWLSDEVLCFRQKDPRIAEGFRRNFNIKERSFDQFPQTADLKGNREFMVSIRGQRVRFFNPDTLTGGCYASSAMICAFVLPRYVPSADEPMITEVDGHSFIQTLAPELRTSCVHTFTWLAEMSRTLPVYSLEYRSPHEAAACLDKVVSTL